MKTRLIDRKNFLLLFVIIFVLYNILWTLIEGEIVNGIAEYFQHPIQILSQ